MLRLSIVIPCAERADDFEDTLVSVLQNRPKDCEVLVIQPRAYDDPYDLCDEVRFVEAVRCSSTVDLINVGVRASRSEVVHLLSCDTEVEGGWTDAAVARFEDDQVGSVSPILTQGNNPSRVVTTGVDFGIGGELIHRNRAVARNQIKRQRTLGPTLHAGFYRRKALLDAGCFRPEAGSLTHVDMALQLRSLGLRHVTETESQVAITRRYSPPLSLARGKQAERLFWQHARSRGMLPSFIAHPAAVAAETFRNLYRPSISLQLLGRLLALTELVGKRGRGDDSRQSTLLKYETEERRDAKPHGRRRAA